MKILNTRILKKSVITLSFLCYLITCGFVPYYYDEATNLCYGDTPIRDKIAISCMLRQIHEFSSHAIRHGLYIKNRKRLFCP